MRRPSLVTIALVPVLLGLMGNLVMGTVKVPDRARLWVWVATALLVVAAVGIEVRRSRPGGWAGQAGIGVDAAASQLAVAVRTQWRQEEERRQVHTPFPLAVRWHAVPDALMDHWANICRVPAGVGAGSLELTGQLDRIVEIYRRIPSGRLVILGRAGSGKTVLALRLVLDLLDVWTTGDPVPVIFSLGSWNPSTASLREWLCDRLVRDYPGLVAPGPAGMSLAAKLVNDHRILPVLDGFDEIATGLHGKALTALSAATAMPLLLTSRPQEYRAAVAAGAAVLTGAAGVELADLTPADLADYLPLTTRRAGTGSGTTTVWDPVLACLRDRPSSLATANLAAVLSTPLMIGLARTIYSDNPDRDPAVLLDTHQFGTATALEDHLLGAFVPAAYQHSWLHLPAGHRRARGYELERAQRWLGYIAHHLDRLNSRDLAWWQLGKTLPLLEILPLGMIVMIVCMLAGIVVTLPFWLVNELPGGYGGEFAVGLLGGLQAALLLGNTYSFMLSFPDLVQPGRVQRPTSGTTKIVLAGVVIGFVAGILIWLLNDNLESAMQAGLAGGLAFGLVSGLGGFEGPVDIKAAPSPWDLLITDRRKAALQALGWWLAAGLMLGLGSVLELDSGFGYAFGLLFGYGLWHLVGNSVWVRWVVFARFWLPLGGRLPWAVMAFLDDAHQRGVLRQTGPVYQFRHARLQDHLAGHYRNTKHHRQLASDQGRSRLAVLTALADEDAAH